MYMYYTYVWNVKYLCVLVCKLPGSKALRRHQKCYYREREGGRERKREGEKEGGRERGGRERKGREREGGRERGKEGRESEREQIKITHVHVNV